jgi:hypothetical protein
MQHNGVGTTRASTRVLALDDEDRTTVTELDTGQILSTHRTDPNTLYWRDQQREPGRSPSPQVACVATHVRPVSRLIAEGNGAEGTRTPDLRAASASLWPTELQPRRM